MNFLYQFEQSKSVEVEKERKDTLDGKEVTIKEMVKENKIIKFYLKKPTRKEKDDAGVYYAATVSQLIQQGVLSLHLIRKRLVSDNGVLAESERKELKTLYDDLLIKDIELQRLKFKNEKEKTEADYKKIKELEGQIDTIGKEVQVYEQTQSSFFDNSAESLARSRLILWYLAHLCFWEPEKNIVNFWGEGTLDIKLDRMDEIVDSEDEFILAAKDEFVLSLTLWMQGVAKTQKDFEEIKKKLNKQNEIDEVKDDIKDDKKEEDKESKPEIKPV
ncbi:MAG: hypothetical protein AABY22_13900 [Nanoarchaeota archaeon]